MNKKLTLFSICFLAFQLFFVSQMFSQYNIFSVSPSTTYSKRALQHDTTLLINGTLRAKTFTASGDIQLGFDSTTPSNSYGKKLYFGYPIENTDDIFMARYNGNTDFPYNVSELRVNVGDNDSNENKFSVGYTLNGVFTPRFTVFNNGNVGIGVVTPQNRLEVNGTIRAKEIKVETGWADFVFNSDYKLPALKDVKRHIVENKRLPDIPTAEEVKANGVNLGEMQSKLLQKIEELTLYVIQQQETIEDLKKEITELKTK